MPRIVYLFTSYAGCGHCAAFKEQYLAKTRDALATEGITLVNIDFKQRSPDAELTNASTQKSFPSELKNYIQFFPVFIIYEKLANGKTVIDIFDARVENGKVNSNRQKNPTDKTITEWAITQFNAIQQLNNTSKQPIQQQPQPLQGQQSKDQFNYSSCSVGMKSRYR